MDFIAYLRKKDWGFWDFLEPAFYGITLYGAYKIVADFVLDTTITFKLTPWGIFLFFVWLPLLYLFVRRFSR